MNEKLFSIYVDINNVSKDLFYDHNIDKTTKDSLTVICGALLTLINYINEKEK